jgi:hypothetical protein
VALFERLNIESFYADYVSQDQLGIDPRLMIRTIFLWLSSRHRRSGFWQYQKQQGYANTREGTPKS